MFGRRSLTILFAFVAALLVAATSFAGGKRGGDGGRGADAATDQIVIRLAAGTTFDAESLDATAGVKLKHVRRLDDGAYVLKLPKRQNATLVGEITSRLASRNDVAVAEADALMQPLLTPNDPRWGEQWDLFSPTSGFFGANLPGAWDLTTGAAGITVGVIDTGHRPHMDLAGRFVAGYDFIGDALVANDGGGRDNDPSDPGDWITSAEDASGYFAGCGADNSSWHGTHVAGTIGAASNNSLGVAGINWGSKIQPLRVLGKCGGYTSDIADAIRWGAGLAVSGVPVNATPSDVLNLSLGGSGTCSSTYQNAINAAVAAGTVVVVAAGNSNANAGNYSPASCSNVITVASTGHTGSRAYYSNYGASIEIAAPGGDAQLGKTILSTLNAGATTPGADSYAYYQGTSMAAPHVAGVASLMLSLNPALTPAQVTSLLQSSVTPFPAGSTCTTSLCGAGILNAAAAVALANGSGGGGGGPSAPGAFSKLAPTNGKRNLARPVVISWGTSLDAASYEWCVSTVSGGACAAAGSTSTATSASVSGLSSKRTYYWQVTARNSPTTSTPANGGTWWSFRTR